MAYQGLLSLAMRSTFMSCGYKRLLLWITQTNSLWPAALSLLATDTGHCQPATSPPSATSQTVCLLQVSTMTIASHLAAILSSRSLT